MATWAYYLSEVWRLLLFVQSEALSTLNYELALTFAISPHSHTVTELRATCEEGISGKFTE